MKSNLFCTEYREKEQTFFCAVLKDRYRSINNTIDVRKIQDRNGRKGYLVYNNEYESLTEIPLVLG